ncbi:DUF169 domain-containing protein [bacterium]|nr:DUF169 domain-containing protein [bacterium]
MDSQHFIDQWNKYFPGAELPLGFYYAAEPGEVTLADNADKHRCVICDLAKVRRGSPLAFNYERLGCAGGRRYFGFSRDLAPRFEYFLSCGIAGELEGERYKRSPELVKELLTILPEFAAPSKYIIFKRWDQLADEDQPIAAIFFATPDVLSGLFTLAGFDQSALEAIYTPFSAGCGSIVHYPYIEATTGSNRPVLGMFDVSARPCVPANVLTLTIPLAKLESMVGYMDESFLITESWNKVRKRIAEK